MNQNRNKAVLTVEVNIRFRGEIYQLSLTNILKWLVPVVVVIARVISQLRRDGP